MIYVMPEEDLFVYKFRATLQDKPAKKPENSAKKPEEPAKPREIRQNYACVTVKKIAL